MTRTTRMTRWTWLLVVVAGCFNTPGLARQDGGGADDGGGGDDGGSCAQPAAGLVLDTNAITHVVTAQFTNNATIGFADEATRYPFPTEISLGGQNVVATPGACLREDLVGVSVYPIYSVAGGQMPRSSTHALERVVVGPAYIELVTHWGYEHAVACNTQPAIRGNGTTTWSLYPDGRVVRRDTIQPSDNATSTVSVNCACSGGDQNFVVTSYAAFDAFEIAALTLADEPSEGTSPIPNEGTDLIDTRGGCFRTAGVTHLGIRWDDSSRGALYSRIRRIGPEIAFVNDLVPVSGQGSETTLTPANTYSLRTHMLLDGAAAESCVAINNRLLATSMPPRLLVDNQPTIIDPRGFYDDAAPGSDHTGAVVVRADGRLERGWAVRLRFPNARSITTSMPSIWQLDAASGAFYVFFPGELPNGGTVTITPC